MGGLRERLLDPAISCCGLVACGAQADRQHKPQRRARLGGDRCTRLWVTALLWGPEYRSVSGRVHVCMSQTERSGPGVVCSRRSVLLSGGWDLGPQGLGSSYAGSGATADGVRASLRASGPGAIQKYAWDWDHTCMGGATERPMGLGTAW